MVKLINNDKTINKRLKKSNNNSLTSSGGGSGRGKNKVEKMPSNLSKKIIKSNLKSIKQRGEVSEEQEEEFDIIKDIINGNNNEESLFSLTPTLRTITQNRRQPWVGLNSDLKSLIISGIKEATYNTLNTVSNKKEHGKVSNQLNMINAQLYLHLNQLAIPKPLNEKFNLKNLNQTQTTYLDRQLTRKLTEKIELKKLIKEESKKLKELELDLKRFGKKLGQNKKFWDTNIQSKFNPLILDNLPNIGGIGGVGVGALNIGGSGSGDNTEDNNASGGDTNNSMALSVRDYDFDQSDEMLMNSHLQKISEHLSNLRINTDEVDNIVNWVEFQNNNFMES